MPEPTVAAGYARGLMKLAASKGANRQDLAQRAEIDPQDLQDADNRIPLAKYAALLRAAKTVCNDSALALHYGEAVNVAESSLVGLMGRASETMLDAFVQLNRYVRLVVDVDEGSADRFHLKRERTGLWFVDTRQNPNDFPELTETGFAQLVCWLRQFGDTPLLKAVHVTHAAPCHRAEYDRIFRVPVVFDSEWNALLMDDAWPTKRVALLPRYMSDVLSKHAQALLHDLDSTKAMRGQVESLLIPILHTGDLRLERIAEKMGLRRQTLYRKLKAEGVSFEKLLDELRHKMALHYLNGKRVSVNETAYLVGFSDPSAFSRAFKRWTGTSPRKRSV